MKTVRIYGMASNLAEAPPVDPSAGIEVWACNDPLRAYNKYRPHTREEFTRWVNVHSKRHMLTEPAKAGGMTARPYPRGYVWYGQQTKPIYLQEVQADVPASQRFPKDEIIAFFGHRYFTFSGAWMIAWAIVEGFKRIELYGFQLSKRKPLYAIERPCFAYWIEEARRRGVEIVYPGIIGSIEGEAGDPSTYDGPLYGYETT